jgi:hypothetical protein
LAISFFLLCDGFVSSAANFIHAALMAALWLLGVSIAFLFFAACNETTGPKTDTSNNIVVVEDGDGDGFSIEAGDCDDGNGKPWLK